MLLCIGKQKHSHAGPPTPHPSLQRSQAQSSQHQPPTKDFLKILRIRRHVHAFVSKQVGRVAVALGGARAMLLDLLSKKAGVELRRKTKQKQRGRENKDPPCICGCVEMHLNLLPPSWSSSSSWPETTAVLAEPLESGLYYYYYYYYYDPWWNTAIPAELQLPQIATYLEWPDEEHEMDDDDDNEEDGGGCNEIDSLAERFIARCHERFMLEKQESYRRYQEMLARSL
ncbi:hypothetical protein BAE44_0010932 [Dichanthelium oligosanthes]|uniref:Uncharacterized protein n=1 Tax=Dichanthelium oligosanthes TaxID=888268 RepID=A0A1E5VSG5_9POAL|nr:hypothetical protein BAE44_0010932 [Dichanthelium oligosanthes]